MSEPTNNPSLIFQRLRAFFTAQEIKARPLGKCFPSNREPNAMLCMATFYIDARDVMNRLDDVVGCEHWRDEYTTAWDKKLVVCRLSLRINGEWITKEDCGGESSQPDEDDRHKSAFSAALKRAAVKWGIGRYLYDIPNLFFPYDEKRKRFIKPPLPPREFLPTQDMAPASVSLPPSPSSPPRIAATPPPQEAAGHKTPDQWAEYFISAYLTAESSEVMAMIDRQARQNRPLVEGMPDQQRLNIRKAREDAHKRLAELAMIASIPFGNEPS